MFDTVRKQYEALAMRPLRIEAHMAEPVVSYMGLHMDSILSYAVVENITEGRMLPNNSPYVRVPLPLRELWISPAGIPLWASTDLLPSGAYASGATYWHRRALSPIMTSRNINTSTGRHKELRTPMPTLNARILRADVFGNADAIAELLQSITSIGKKRHTIGTVADWRIAPIDTFSLIDAEQRLLRPVPITALLRPGNLMLDMVRLAFSPPYWLTGATATFCAPTGYQLRPDFSIGLDLHYAA